MPKPETIKSQNLRDYLEIMTKVVFQIGISWKVVDSKWPSIKEAFKDFDSTSVPTLASRPLFRTFVNSSSSWVTRDHTSSYWSSEKKLLPMTNGMSPESPSRLEPRATTDAYGKPNHPKTDDYIN